MVLALPQLTFCQRIPCELSQTDGARRLSGKVPSAARPPGNDQAERRERLDLWDALSPQGGWPLPFPTWEAPDPPPSVINREVPVRFKFPQGMVR